MLARFIGTLLVKALRSEAFQDGTVEVTRYLARRATKLILRRLQAGSKRFTD